jgi:spore coat polysaccharide biosynthesis protein SpsF
MTEAAVVLQARMGSTRLPGKVLQTIGQQTILAHCVRRLQAADAGPVIVATTTDLRDDEVAAEARRLGVGVYRGPVDDVLARYIGAAATEASRFIIRATADNPAVDIASARRLLDLMARDGTEYGIESGLPYGSTVEAIGTATLRRVAELTADPADREHVTLYVKNHPSAFRMSAPEAPLALRRPDLRFTVDTPEDLVFMRAVIARAGTGSDPTPLADLIAAADVLIAGGRAA